MKFNDLYKERDLMYLLQLETEERKLFLELAHNIANSDGIIVEQEKEMLERYRDEMNLSKNEYTLQNLSLDIIIDKLSSSTKETKRILFLEALAIAFSDGLYDDNPKKITSKLRDAFNISLEKYEKIKHLLVQINHVYSELDSFIYAS